jgi:hypothetical protein
MWTRACSLNRAEPAASVKPVDWIETQGEPDLGETAVPTSVISEDRELHKRPSPGEVTTPGLSEAEPAREVGRGSARHHLYG